MKSLPPAALAVLIAGTALLAAPGVHAETVEVTSVGLAFSPDSITIDAGDTVRWTNLQAGFHNVAETDAPADNVWNGTGFRSGLAGTLDTYEVTFSTPGTFYYVCEPHAFSEMKGEITVRALPAPVAGDLGLWLSILALITVATGTLLHVNGGTTGILGRTGLRDRTIPKKSGMRG